MQVCANRCCSPVLSLYRSNTIRSLRTSSTHHADASPPAAVSQLVQSKGSWLLQTTGEPLPRLLLIDGTNIACLSAGSKHSRRSPFKEPVADRFNAWIRFLQAATAADAVLVAFDNKGSSDTNVRAQLSQQRYLRQRYKQQQGQTAVSYPGGRGSSSSITLNGWGHLAQSITQSGCVVTHAVYGYEADDVLAAAAQWAAAHLQPRPLVLLASSDSDMQQLMDSHTYWLELLQVVSKQYPSGLQLHSAGSFTATNGFAPRSYPDFLSLAGKPEAGVAGAGISAKLARTLLNKFGSLDAVLAAGESGALKPYGAAEKQLGSGPAAADNRQAAAANMAVLGLHPRQQQLPEKQLRECYASAVAAQQQQPQQQQHVARLAALHPARRAHMEECQCYLQQLSACLSELGLTQHQVGWLSPGGLWCDLIVRLKHSSGSSSSSSNNKIGSSSSASCSSRYEAHAGGSMGDTDPTARSGDWLVLQLLGPGDLTNGPEPPGGWSSSSSSSSYEAAVDQLAQQLSSSCGCFLQGSSSLGHPKRSLMAYATGSAKRHLALLKSAGWRVAVVPFHELHPELEQQRQAGLARVTASSSDAVMTRGHGASSRGDAGSPVQHYVAAMLKGQCGDVPGLFLK